MVVGNDQIFKGFDRKCGSLDFSVSSREPSILIVLFGKSYTIKTNFKIEQLS